MVDYEKEQNRLLQLLEDVESEIESADEDEGDKDHIEERDKDSKLEQDLETEAEENIDSSRHMEDYTRPRNALKTNALEIRALLGLLYFGAVRKVNHLNSSDLWKTNRTSVEIFRLVMSQYRFRFLLRNIRFDDKSTRLQRLETDKMTAIRELFEAFVVNCQKHYKLSAYATVDEKLEALRGRCGFRQYIPSKPNKYGVKIFALVDAKMFYITI
ncbi:hypothetical protein NQ314_016926 [Rhamnusium bicolor]|uniref:PiggyBac transposable element-derived protein domain-containing protein n=1 Tax=Rhamnusium bicolor TaxID=1586634 RepID=A0AAV8WXE3_9CUCU|nr:hypothetical protein NQ314_016926 [Rhamnusium bicolor]